MSFRSRLRLAFLLVILVPMGVFALAVRREMSGRLTAQYERRVAALAAIIQEDLEGESEVIRATLAGLSEAIVNDNRFRRGAVDRLAAERRYLLDYAGNAMRLTGLSMLQVQDEAGRIISSGHFRNEYDRLEPELPELLAEVAGGVAIVEARSPEGPFLALARIDSTRMGGRRFALVGGVSVERRFLARLARDADLSVALIYPGGMLTSGAPLMSGEAAELEQSEAFAVHDSTGVVAGERFIPFVDAGRGMTDEARIRVTHTQAELEALRRSIDVWFAVAVAATAVVALLLAGWLSKRISRPLVELAQKTSRVDLDRLDIDFTSRRKDEIGALSRLMGAMTDRLRASAARLREAERRATLGELARQVNHDIKNGLAPIRNVLRHLFQVARDEPGQLSQVVDERRGTLDSSIAYLETLASNYARLYPRLEPRHCDVNAVIRQVASGFSGSAGPILELELAESLPTVLADAVVLRRIVENLVDNAVDALESGPGRVKIATALVADGQETSRVSLTVADTGRGMSEEQRSKIFDDFYTTKPEGTGLGLSIVRRLVMDLSGTIQVRSEEGKGTSFTVELPASDRTTVSAPAGKKGAT